MPSARAALGLPSAQAPLTAASQQGTASIQASQGQTSQSVANGEALEGKPKGGPTADGQATEGKSERVPTAMKGSKGRSSAQAQPVDMEKLLTVPAGIKHLAANSSDAHALLLKVCS